MLNWGLKELQERREMGVLNAAHTYFVNISAAGMNLLLEF